VPDSRTRLLSVVRPAVGGEDVGPAEEPVLEPGLADVITLQRRKSAALTDGDEESFFLDTVAEYQWARDAAGLAATTLDRPHGSGPRQREAYLFQEGRDLLWWYVEEVRGEFGDDPENPSAPLFPSERLPPAVAALNVPTGPRRVILQKTAVADPGSRRAFQGV
jgi:hypothetical protein